MLIHFFILGLFSLGCSGISVTPGDYDVSTSLVTDECGFFNDTEFENETWVLTVSEDDVITFTIEEDSYDFIPNDDSYVYEDVTETDLGDGAILIADEKSRLTFENDAFAGTSSLGYSCGDGEDCEIDELPCNIALELAGTLIVE